MSLGELFGSMRGRRRSATQSYEEGAPNSEITDASPPTDDLVDFQCRHCCFRAKGTHGDVEIAARAHRHPNLNWYPWTVPRGETMEKALRGVNRASVSGHDSPAATLSSFYIWGGHLCSLLATAGSALVSPRLVDTWYPSMGGWIHGSFMLLIVAGLLYTLLRYENERRGAQIQRLRVVAECNDQIRNALQVLIWNHDGRLEHGALGISHQIADAAHASSNLVRSLPETLVMRLSD